VLNEKLLLNLFELLILRCLPHFIFSFLKSTQAHLTEDILVHVVFVVLRDEWVKERGPSSGNSLQTLPRVLFLQRKVFFDTDSLSRQFRASTYSLLKNAFS
jgi:hypothetical protein